MGRRTWEIFKPALDIWEKDHISPEKLICFIQGHMDKKERYCLARHLNRCPDCFEIFYRKAAIYQREKKKD